MAYSGGYNFVIDSSFTPMSLQEMLVPFTAYKDAFEKTEEAYVELSDKSNKFKYLSEQLPEGSKARQIYEGYADTLASQAEDLARNGLTAGNRRALTSLKRRYSGEIGRLEKADEALQKEKELRRARGLQDSSMLYAVDNMTVDDFLDGNNPNLYGISGTELYTRGAAAGKAASSRVFSAGDGGKTLGGYYRDYVQKLGYNAETIARFRRDASTIPELQQAAEDILAERGVLGNLSGEALARARQSVINGMIDGAVYSEAHNPQRDLGVMSASELDSSRQGWARIALAKKELELKAAAAAAAAGGDNASSMGFDARRVSTDAEISQDKADKDAWSKYSNYFVKDPKTGSWKMTAEGMKKYNETPYVYTGKEAKSSIWGPVGAGYGTTGKNHPDTGFKKFVDSHGLTEMAKGRTGKGQTENLNNFIDRINGIYDKNVNLEYYGQIGASQHDDVFSTLARISVDGKVPNYKRVKEGNGYTLKEASPVDISKLTSSDIQNVTPVTGKHGNFLDVTLKGGEKLIVPLGVISQNYDHIAQGNINTAEELRMMKAQGMQAVPINGRLVDIDVAINMAISHSLGNFDSALGTTVVEPVKRAQGVYVE